MLWRYQIGKIQNNITYVSSGVIYNGSLGTYLYRVSGNHWHVSFGSSPSSLLFFLFLPSLVYRNIFNDCV